LSDPEDKDELRELFDAGCAAWPGIDLSFEVFAARATGAKLLEADRESALARGCDLYLVCACEEGNALALAQFDRYCLDHVRDAIARIDASADFIAEVRQVLRERLLVGPEAKIRDFRGAGALKGWVRTVAVRTALNLKRTHRHHDELGESTTPMDQMLSPELAMIKERHKDEIHAAIKRALGQLGREERLLLRFYYVDNLTLNKLAVLNKVAVSTIFRRLEAATQAVLEGVRSELVERLQLSEDSLDSLLRDVHSSMDLNLSKLFATG
jgi:RNA polymerase sigma-70 factor (ECF subfamily)